MTTRRSFLENLAMGSMAMALAKPSAGDQKQSAKSKQGVILYEGEYPGWPWITKGSNGILYCVFREGTIHDYSSSGRIMFTKSVDNGCTWSQAVPILDSPQIDDRNTAISEVHGGTLLVCFNTYTSDRESAAMVMHSNDDGSSWTVPISTGTPNTRTRSAAIILKNGNLLLPYYIAPGSGALAGLSMDNGKTWKSVRIPDSEGFIGDEWDALETEPGRIIGIFRNNHPQSDGTFWVSESHDSGKTWSIPKPSNVQSKRAPSPPQIMFHNGVPTLIYSDRRMVSVSAVTTSDSSFLHWDVEDQLLCFAYNKDESPIMDGGYPCSVQTEKNERLIVDYEIRPNTKRIAGYFIQFTENWGVTR